MHRSIIIIAALLGCVLGAAAQDTPSAEVFLGYTYTRVNSATNIPAFSTNGGGGQFVLNLGKWGGAVADVGAVHNGNIGGYHLDSTITNFLIGPRFPIRVSNRVTPYLQALFGGVYATTSSKVEVPDGTVILPPVVTPYVELRPDGQRTVALRSSASQTAFAMAFGGGLDIKINRHVSFRPIGLDWYRMSLENLRTLDDNHQHCLRYTTGFNFTFGAQ